jgi:hypothetical protein
MLDVLAQQILAHKKMWNVGIRSKDLVELLKECSKKLGFRPSPSVER